MGEHPLKAAVFLDRDGVLNRAIVRDGRPYAPTTVEAFEILPDARPALDRLRDAGFALVVVTNQPEIARGTIDPAVLEHMHDLLRAALPVDEVRVCPHDGPDGCGCRKPKAGLLTRPPAYDLARSFVVGDRWRDVDAGRAAGVCATILIDYGYREAVPHEPDLRVSTLAAAVDWILERSCDNPRPAG